MRIALFSWRPCSKSKFLSRFHFWNCNLADGCIVDDFSPVELLGLRPWHLSTRFVERNPPTFVGRSRLRTAKAEAYPPSPRLRRIPSWHSSTGLHPWISAKEGKLLFRYPRSR